MKKLFLWHEYCITKFMKKIILGFIILALAACTASDKPPLRERISCQNDLTFRAEFARDGSEATLIPTNGQRVTLPAIDAAEGNLFSNGMTSLIVANDGEMTIEQDGKPLMTQCDII